MRDFRHIEAHAGIYDFVSYQSKHDNLKNW